MLLFSRIFLIHWPSTYVDKSYNYSRMLENNWFFLPRTNLLFKQYFKNQWCNFIEIFNPFAKFTYYLFFLSVTFHIFLSIYSVTSLTFSHISISCLSLKVGNIRERDGCTTTFSRRKQPLQGADTGFSDGRARWTSLDMGHDAHKSL